MQYVEFLLDLSESKQHPQVSLDDLKVFTGPTAGLVSLNLSNATLEGLPAVYDMDGEFQDLPRPSDPTDWRVDLYTSLASKGKTTGDMLFYLPVSKVTYPGEANPYVYLYSKLGSDFAAEGKADSWSHGVGAAVSPSTAGTLDATGLFTPPAPPVPPAPPADSGTGDTGGGTGGDTGGGDGTIWL